MRQQFSIFKRKNAKGHRFFYVAFRDPKTGERDKHLSIDKLFEQLKGFDAYHVTNRTEATMIANEALRAGLVYPDDKNSSSVLFIDYASNLWDYDKSPYIQRRNKEKAGSIHRVHARDILSALNNHCFPYLPENLKLSDFLPAYAEQIKDRMLNEGKSASTINKVLIGVRVALSEAYRLGYISSDIAGRIQSVPINSADKPILKKTEVMKLLSFLDASTTKGTYERARYLIPAIAVYTGMRQGEIIALQKSDIALSATDDESSILFITHSYNRLDGIKSTKNNKSKTVPIPTPLCKEILSYADASRNNFIFYNLSDIKKPISADTVRDWFKEALSAIGIDENRGIVFHSLRHCFASFFNGELSDEDRKTTLGHSSIGMTRYYTHETEEHVKKIGKSIEEILPYAKDEE